MRMRWNFVPQSFLHSQHKRGLGQKSSGLIVTMLYPAANNVVKEGAMQNRWGKNTLALKNEERDDAEQVKQGRSP